MSALANAHIEKCDDASIGGDQLPEHLFFGNLARTLIDLNGSMSALGFT
jgi:hypothetical protein